MTNKIFPDRAMTTLLSFRGDEPIYFDKTSKKCLSTVLRTNWEKLKAASGVIVQSIMAEIDKKYAEHEPDGYKLFRELHEKLKSSKSCNPPQYLAIAKKFKGSLSHERFIALSEMVETAEELSKVWDAIAPNLNGAKMPGKNGQRYFHIALWFNSPANQPQLASFTCLDLHGLKLTRVPEVVFKFKMVTVLDLRHNPIKHLPLEKFKSLPSLSAIDLRGTAIDYEEQTQIVKQIPVVLPRLNICEMDKVTFATPSVENLSKVWDVICQVLTLRKQFCLTWFADRSNDKLLHTITELDLRGKKLTDLPSEIGRCINLTSLNLKHNDISEERQKELSQILPSTFLKLKTVYFDIGRADVEERVINPPQPPPVQSVVNSPAHAPVAAPVETPPPPPQTPIPAFVKKGQPRKSRCPCWS